MRKILLTVFLVVLTVQSVQAARHDNRQKRQGARIAQGIKSGEITRGEARKLKHGQAHIRRAERRAERDGVVTDRERARLERKQDRQSERIYDAKHNDQNRNEINDNNSVVTPE